MDSDGSSTIATDVTDVPTVSRISCNSSPQDLNKCLREQVAMLDVSGDVYKATTVSLLPKTSVCELQGRRRQVGHEQEIWLQCSRKNIGYSKYVQV